MTRSRHIVVGVDGSDDGRRALRWAVREAVRRGGTVQAVTAFSFQDAEASSPQYRRAEQQRVETMLGSEVSAALNDNPHVTLTTRVVFGTPADVLIDTAQNADLLVLGSRGRSRIAHAILGSVAESCARRATCPVVVVPVPHSAEPHATTEPVSTGIPTAIL
jgi:nucleotide-binding universal stress UspA family protein